MCTLYMNISFINPHISCIGRKITSYDHIIPCHKYCLIFVTVCLLKRNQWNNGVGVLGIVRFCGETDSKWTVVLSSVLTV